MPALVVCNSGMRTPVARCNPEIAQMEREESATARSQIVVDATQKD